MARLSDGTWSAPSAIGTAGGGFGGQIGFELTDYVFILNDVSAVRAFSQQASLTLGGNVSIAAGPVGRNAEAAGAASLKGVAGVFAYSKTKGLFAGVSLEGSVLIERRDANERLYNGKVTARQLLEGSVRPPPAADPLLSVLNSRVFSGNYSGHTDNMYNDIPIYDNTHDNGEGHSGAGYGSNARPGRNSTMGPPRASTWADNVYDRPPNQQQQSRFSPTTSPGSQANPTETFERIDRRNSVLSPPNTGSSHRITDSAHDSNSNNNSKPTRPTAPKPVFKPRTASLGKDQARALYTFDADQEGDLAFKKGDIITITKRTESAEDWWTGKIGDRTGIFPSNYVEVVQ